MDVMFEIPSRKDIRLVNIDADVILGNRPPRIYDSNGQELLWTDTGSLHNPAA